MSNNIRIQTIWLFWPIGDEGGSMPTQYSVLGYRIDLYFYDYKFAIEFNENGHSDRIIDYEIIRRQKAVEQELGCKFIRIDPDKEDQYF